MEDLYRRLRGSQMVSENAEPGEQNAPIGGPKPQLAKMGEAMRTSAERAFGGLEVDFKASASLGKLISSIDANTNATLALHRWLSTNPIGAAGGPTPRIWRASRVTPAGASTYSVLLLQAPFDVGGPNGGVRWWLGAHFIQGTDPFTVVANSVVALYVGGIPVQDGATAPDIEAIDSSIRYSVTTLPWGGTFGPRTITILPGDTIYWVVKSAGNNQKLTGSVIVYEYSERMLGGIV